MSDRYPFDANGNLLPGLRVVDGVIVAASGEVVDAPVPEAAEEAPADETVAESSSETKPSLAEE